MLNKIKEKFIHILREKCGYYEMEEIKGHYQNMCFNYSEDFKIHNDKINKLSSLHEAKILEYDILDAQVKNFPNLYKKYLVAELEQMLNIMKEKGIHPQDLIVRIINKANRDIK